MILWILLIPLLGTVLGASFVFFIKNELSPSMQKLMLGFASGVMIAASMWSLLLPGIEAVEHIEEWYGILPVVFGFLAGMAFLLLIDYITPHLHPSTLSVEGRKAKVSRTTMLALALAIHNLPEGMAVGVLIGGALDGTLGITTQAAISMAIGIAIQNIPEGAIISMPMRAEGNSRLRSFLIGSLSGIVEPIGALIIILLSGWLLPAMPFLLAFAAGAMLYVVVEELIPESASGEHSNLNVVGFAIGFVLMMLMDTLLG